MNHITSASKLLFFKAERYEYNEYHVFDVSDCPRPHFCMGLILEGTGIFEDCENGGSIQVEPGDIIFVPITSRYISRWEAKPRASYVSMHFIFDDSAVFSRQKNFMLQKVRLEGLESLKEDFEYVLRHYNRDEAAVLAVLGKFYSIMSRILPELKKRDPEVVDARISKAVAYMEQHYDGKISIDELAEVSNMSVPRFYPNFKREMGVTPVEYLNHYRVSRAIILLMQDEALTVENISDMVGFESPEYFRRVFKKVTGRTPREYRGISMEI